MDEDERERERERNERFLDSSGAKTLGEGKGKSGGWFWFTAWRCLTNAPQFWLLSVNGSPAELGQIRKRLG